MKQQPTTPKLSTILAILILLVSISIAIKPELLLRFNGGWLPYFLLGYSEVPPIFSKKFWQEPTQEWLNSGDVVVSSGAKSGTTFLLVSAHSIRTKGFDTGYLDIFLETPFPDLVRFPGETRKQKISLFRSISDRYSFGIYKTHYPPPIIPIRDDVKYLVAVRDPIDAVSSFRPFLNSVDQEWAKDWGGFGGRFLTQELVDNVIMNDKGDGKGGMFLDMTVDHIAGWWPYRKRSNVLFCHYKDRLKDPSGDIDRISKFLGIQLTSEEKKNVLEITSFKWMKKNDKRFRICHIYDEPKRYGLVGQNFECMLGNFTGTGPNRKGEEEIPTEMKNQALKIATEKLGVEIVQWLRSGGPMPDVELPK
jgi:aryl sulfotransferase